MKKGEVGQQKRVSKDGIELIEIGERRRFVMKSGEFETVDGEMCEKPSNLFKKKRIFRRGYTVNNQAV